MAKSQDLENKITYMITNNTKGVRYVEGVQVNSGGFAEITEEQYEAIKKNPAAMAWIEAGDLSLT